MTVTQAETGFTVATAIHSAYFVIADISGSVAAFARFTLHLVHAIASQFSRVRSFVFIDGIDEVTRFFEGTEDIVEAVHAAISASRVRTEFPPVEARYRSQLLVVYLDHLRGHAGLDRGLAYVAQVIDDLVLVHLRADDAAVGPAVAATFETTDETTHMPALAATYR